MSKHYEDKVIKDTIKLEGDDWNYQQHQVIDTVPTFDDFYRVVKNYVDFKMDQIQKLAEMNSKDHVRERMERFVR